MATRLNPRALDRIKYENAIRDDKDLATRLNVSPVTVSRWRAGAMSPSMEAIAKIVLDYGIPVQDLVIRDTTLNAA